MLTKPEWGWTRFSLEGTAAYSLSYLDDIPVEWLDQTIHGLETFFPFTVKGCMEPEHFLCTVSYWNCHIIVEKNGEREPARPEDAVYELSHTGMLAFCKLLLADINANFEEWVKFYCSDDYYEEDDEEEHKNYLKRYSERRRMMKEKVEKLESLIAKRERSFEAE